MYYFGIIFSMKLSYIKQRTEFLREFLELKTADALCKTLRLVCGIILDRYNRQLILSCLWVATKCTGGYI